MTVFVEVGFVDEQNDRRWRGRHFFENALKTFLELALDARTGKELWKGRLGGTFSSSPVLVGELIFVTNEAGETFVFKANPRRFELLAENKLGNEVFATPTICAGRIYMRVAEQQGDRRQEMLYCLGK